MLNLGKDKDKIMYAEVALIIFSILVTSLWIVKGNKNDKVSVAFVAFF